MLTEDMVTTPFNTIYQYTIINSLHFKVVPRKEIKKRKVRGYGEIQICNNFLGHPIPILVQTGIRFE